MKKLVVIIIFCLAQLASHAQYKNNKWLIGQFSTYPPPWGSSILEFQGNAQNISLDPRNMWFSSCFSGLSNKDENWFVYSNGAAICNKDHDTLINGGDLGPGADPISPYGLKGPAQAIFFPGDTVNQRHYFFHQNTKLNLPGHPVGNQPSSLQLYYSVIDPLAANGRGEVVSKNNLVINDTIDNGNVLVVRHANGRDWWVLMKRFYSNLFYSILVTPDSVYTPITFNVQSPIYYLGGQACFSPDGEHYASFSANSQLKIYDFDRCVGTLSNYRGKFISNQLSGSTSFSPNSRYLYITTVDSLWQFDMQAPDVPASQTFIANYDGFTDSVGGATIFWWHWLAPNGKIYLTSNITGQRLHVINNPDMPGQACDFQQHSIDLPTYNNYTIPSPINLALYQLPGSPCDTLGVGSPTLALPKGEGISVAPNPSDGRFSIAYTPQRVSGMLYVYDIAGKEVYREYVSPFTSIKNLDLSERLSNGMYAVSLVFGNSRMMGKVVVK